MNHLPRILTKTEYRPPISSPTSDTCSGVRVFEGINFLTRDPSPGPERLAAMHERAKAAGMYPYGASPEQMHYVEHGHPGGGWGPPWKGDSPPRENHQGFPLVEKVKVSLYVMFCNA